MSLFSSAKGAKADFRGIESKAVDMILLPTSSGLVSPTWNFRFTVSFFGIHISEQTNISISASILTESSEKSFSMLISKGQTVSVLYPKFTKSPYPILSGTGKLSSPINTPFWAVQLTLGAAPESPGLIQYVCQPLSMRTRKAAVKMSPGLTDSTEETRSIAIGSSCWA